MYTISVPRTENWKTCSGQRQLYVEGGDWSHMEDLISSLDKLPDQNPLPCQVGFEP